MTFYKTGLPLAHELFHKIKGEATSHHRLIREASVRNENCVEIRVTLCVTRACKNAQIRDYA